MVFTFFVCSWPRFLKPYFGVDTWRILLITDYLREKKSFPKYLSSQYIVKGLFDHPVILSWILSFFPKEFVKKYQWAVSPLFESLHSLLAFFLTYFLTKNPYFAFVAQLIYSLTPMVALESSQLSTRSIGSFWFSLSFIPTILYLNTNNPIFLLLSIAMFIGLFYCHRMSTQVFFLVFIVFSFFYKTFIFYGIFFSSMALAIVCFKGYYYRILNGHLMLLRQWHKFIDIRYAHQIRGVQRKTTWQNMDFVKKIESLFVQIPVLSLLSPNPWMILVFFVLVFTSKYNYASILSLLPLGHTEAIVQSLFLWTLSTFLFAVLTNVIKPLRFMGSGERYIEYGALPNAIICALCIQHFLNIKYTNFIWYYFVVSCTIIFIVIIFFQWKVVIKDTNRSITPALKKIFDFINSYKKEVRIGCIPHQLADSVLYFTKAKVMLTDSNHNGKEMFLYWNPIIKTPIEETLKRYNLNTLLVNTSYVTIDELKLKNFKTVFQFENYFVLEVSY